MRKNIFEVSEEERKRIIKSHIEATKNNYLLESQKDSTEDKSADAAKKVIETVANRLSSDVEITYDNGCWSTLWIDNFAGENLQVVACNGGWISIRPTTTWKGVEGSWTVYNNYQTNTPTSNITIEMLGKKLNSTYSPATPDKSGGLFSSLLCQFMTNKEVCNWDFWENWSWNADSLFYQQLDNCNKQSIADCWKTNKNVKSGFWDSLLDLLPGDW